MHHRRACKMALHLVNENCTVCVYGIYWIYRSSQRNDGRYGHEGCEAYHLRRGACGGQGLRSDIMRSILKVCEQLWRKRNAEKTCFDNFYSSSASAIVVYTFTTSSSSSSLSCNFSTASRSSAVSSFVSVGIRTPSPDTSS